MWNRFDSINKARFAKRVATLNTVGNAGTVSKVIASKKEKLTDPRRQRKQKFRFFEAE